MKIRKKSCADHVRKPKWLSRPLPKGSEYERVRQIVKGNSLATVCQEARCPNQFECFSKGSATFMILGEQCTRNCRFCNVQHGKQLALDPGEPERVAEAVCQMDLKYVVVTSVTRDDLPDGGASIFADTIKAIREVKNDILIEVLIPDFQGDTAALETVIQAKPDVLNHNIETVPRLYPAVRPQAEYQRSLDLLQRVKTIDSEKVVKTGIMVGLGETDKELEQVFDDVLKTGCDILIMGQYLQPSDQHVPVERYVEPQQFTEFEKKARGVGIRAVVAEPLVRSSYRAEELYNEVIQGKRVM